MKKYVMVVAAALLLGTVSFAQSAGPRGGAPKGQRPPQGQRGPGGGMEVQKKIMDQVGLSAAQKAKVEALNKARMEKLKGMRTKATAAGAKPDRAAMQATFKKMNDEYKASLQGIMTKAQYAKYESLMKAEMEKFRKEHPGGPGGAPGAKAGAGKAGKKGG